MNNVNNATYFEDQNSGDQKSPFFKSSALPFWIIAYYIAFFVFAFFATHATASGSLQGARLLPALFTAWFGAAVGTLLIWVFLETRFHPRLFQLLLIGAVVDAICNFAALGVEKNLGGESTLATAFFWFLVASANLGILLVAVGGGLLVARGLKQPNYLIMAAVVGAITDIFSVYAGPTKHIVSTSAFPYLSFHWGVWQQGVLPCVGMGDFLFLCLYFAGARQFGLSSTRTFFAMLAAFALGFLSLLITPQGVPALPFMSAFLLLVHGRALKAQMRAPYHNS